MGNIIERNGNRGVKYVQKGYIYNKKMKQIYIFLHFCTFRKFFFISDIFEKLVFLTPKKVKMGTQNHEKKGPKKVQISKILDVRNSEICKISKIRVSPPQKFKMGTQNHEKRGSKKHAKLYRKMKKTTFFCLFPSLSCSFWGGSL